MKSLGSKMYLFAANLTLPSNNIQKIDTQTSLKFFPEVSKSSNSNIILNYRVLIILEMLFSIVFFIKVFLEDRYSEKLVVLSILLLFDMILLINEKFFHSKFDYYFLSLKQISFVVTSYFLLSDQLSKSQMFYLGFYVLYLNSKIENNNLSFLTFSISNLCFSFDDLENNDNKILIIMNFFVCLLQAFSKKSSKIDNNNNSKNILSSEALLPGYIFNNIYPGANIILKKKNSRGNSSNISEYVNFMALKEFEISNYKDLMTFFTEMTDIQKFNFTILSPKKYKKNIESEIKNSKETPNPLIDVFQMIFENKSNQNFFFRAFSLKKHTYFNIRILSFDYNKESFIFVNIDKNNSRKVLKTLTEISERKDKVLASVSHDLRSPLSGIITFINYAKTIEDPVERNKYLDYSRINADLLMSMINDLLDFSAINNGKINLNISDMSLNLMIKEIYELMKTQAEIKNIHLKISNEYQSEDVMIISDSRRIKQILINLLNNSIKFTLKGFVQLNISKTENKDIIKFEVIDSGVGIKEEIIKSLGKEYATFDTENGLNKYGLGLGLNICTQLIKLLGPNEKLYISSIYGKGTKIGFLINKKIKEIQTSLSLKTIITQSPRRKKVFFETNNSLKSIPEEKIQSNEEKNNIYKKEKNLLENENIQHFQNKKQSISNNSNDRVINSPENFNLNDSPYPSSENHNRKISLCLFNSEMGNRRSLLKNESKHNKEIEEIENKRHKPCLFIDTKSNNFNFDEAFSSFDSFCLESPELNYLNEGDIKIPLSISDNIDKIKPQDKINKISKIKILLVDDGPFNILVMQSYFKKIKNYDFEINTAANGVECLELFLQNNGTFSNEPYKFIFMDCLMPIKDGYITSKEIKEFIKKGDYYDVIIIAVTGMSSVVEQKKCLEHGMDDFLVKPLQEKDLIDILQFYIHKFGI